MLSTWASSLQCRTFLMLMSHPTTTSHAHDSHHPSFCATFHAVGLGGNNVTNNGHAKTTTTALTHAAKRSSEREDYIGMQPRSIGTISSSIYASLQRHTLRREGFCGLDNCVPTVGSWHGLLEAWLQGQPEQGAHREAD